VIRIAITPAAYQALAETLPAGARREEPIQSGGMFLIWVDRAGFNRLTAARGPKESYSDVILRLAASAA